MALSPALSGVGDVATESDETFAVSFGPPAPAGDVVLAPSVCNQTILDDDAAVSVEVASVLEGDAGTKQLRLDVTLSHPNPRAISFTWSTAGGTATAGSDYVAVSNAAATIPSGTESKSFFVTIKGDLVPEGAGAVPVPAESFNVSLASVTGGQPGTTVAEMRIIDEEANCTVFGTVGNDTLAGTPGADVYCGFSGNDTFTYSGGADVYWSGNHGSEPRAASTPSTSPASAAATSTRNS